MEESSIKYTSDKRPPSSSSWHDKDDWQQGESSGIDIIDDALVANEELLRSKNAPESGIARWTFDDEHIESGTLLDIWGGYHATINGPTTGIAGPKRTYNTGQAFQFDGSGTIDTTLSPSDVGVQGSNPKSISIWAYPEVFNGGGLFEWGITGTSGYDFSLRTRDTVGEYRTQFWSDADIDFSFGGTDEWIHFVVSWDGSETRVYANGKLQAQGTYPLDTKESHLRIGKWNDHLFKGRLTDVRIYSKSLSAAKVSSLYSDGQI